MQVLHDRCAGLDVHKKTVVCCVWITSPNGHATHETRTFSTMVEAGPDRPRSMIKGIYHMLARGTPWIELGADYFERRNPLKIVSRLTHRLRERYSRNRDGMLSSTAETIVPKANPRPNFGWANIFAFSIVNCVYSAKDQPRLNATFLSRRMRHLFLLLGLGLLIAGMPSALADNLDRSAGGRDVRVELSSPLSTIPPGGCVPFHVEIKNESRTPGTWVINFESSSYQSGQQTLNFQQNMTVAGNSTGAFDFAVPLSVTRTDGSTNTIQVSVNGPGFDSGNAATRNLGYFYQNGSNRSVRSPYAILGKELLGAPALGPLQTLYTTGKREFYGSMVDVKSLSSDWRGLTGVASLLLKDSEWLSLPPGPRDAICDYVAQGGHLTLFTPDEPETVATRLRLPTTDGKPGVYGFGLITLNQLETTPPSAKVLQDAVEAHPAPTSAEIDSLFSTWDLRVSLGMIAVSSGFIIAFVFVFGALVGPVNLFVFARGKNRFRLFWTTPLLSLLASLGLIIGILFTDGLGGQGKQMLAFFSLPGTNREVVIQEQASRSAVLFNNRFRNTQSYLITPVSMEVMNAAMAHEGDFSSRRFSNHGDNTPNTYSQTGDELSGSWFPTRAITGQYLQAMRPTRSTLSVLNNDGFTKRGEAPIVLSSFADELSEVHLLDERGKYWVCRHLQPGRQQTCQSDSREDYARFWKTSCQLAGGKLRPSLQAAGSHAGYFYASGHPGSGESLTTLDEVSWKASSGVYLGPWVVAPEKSP